MLIPKSFKIGKHLFCVGTYRPPQLGSALLDDDDFVDPMDASDPLPNAGELARRSETIFGEDSLDDTKGLTFLALVTVVVPGALLLYFLPLEIASVLTASFASGSPVRLVATGIAHLLGPVLMLANTAFWLFRLRGTLRTFVTGADLFWWRRLGPFHCVSHWNLSEFGSVEIQESSDSQFRLRTSRFRIYLLYRDPRWCSRRRVVLSSESAAGARERAHWLEHACAKSGST